MSHSATRSADPDHRNWVDLASTFDWFIANRVIQEKHGELIAHAEQSLLLFNAFLAKEEELRGLLRDALAHIRRQDVQIQLAEDTIEHLISVRNHLQLELRLAHAAIASEDDELIHAAKDRLTGYTIWTKRLLKYILPTLLAAGRIGHSEYRNSQTSAHLTHANEQIEVLQEDLDAAHSEVQQLGTNVGNLVDLSEDLEIRAVRQETTLMESHAALLEALERCSDAG